MSDVPLEGLCLNRSRGLRRAGCASSGSSTPIALNPSAVMTSICASPSGPAPAGPFRTVALSAIRPAFNRAFVARVNRRASIVSGRTTPRSSRCDAAERRTSWVSVRVFVCELFAGHRDLLVSLRRHHRRHRDNPAIGSGPAGWRGASSRQSRPQRHDHSNALFAQTVQSYVRARLEMAVRRHIACRFKAGDAEPDHMEARSRPALSSPTSVIVRVEA